MSIYLTIFLLFILIILFKLLSSFFKLALSKSKSTFSYQTNKFLITKVEHEFFDILQKHFGNQYYIFPQVHLSTIFNHKIMGQNWQSARNHIDRKSIDFLICNKNFINPLLGIELDDKTHQKQDRQTRDLQVENIFNNAGLPLIRFQNHGRFDEEEIVKKLNNFLLNRK